MANLTSAQIITLRAAALADPTAAAFFVSAATAPDKETHSYSADLLAYLNGNSTFIVWRSITPVPDVLDAITWASMTPSDTPDGDPTALQREYRCQGKQLNLQVLLQGRDYLTTGKTNIRAALSDALTQVPSGTAGAMVDAGWLGAGKVKATISRPATVAEAMVATGTGTAGTPGTLVIDGPLSQQEVNLMVFKDDGTVWTA